MLELSVCWQLDRAEWSRSPGFGQPIRITTTSKGGLCPNWANDLRGGILRSLPRTWVPGTCRRGIITSITELNGDAPRKSRP